MAAPFKEWQRLFLSNFDQYKPKGYALPLGGTPWKLIYINQPKLFIVWIFLTLILACTMVYRKAWTTVWFVPVALIISSIPTVLLVWHADPLEIERHALQVGIMLRVGVWFLFILAVDALLRPRLGEE